MTIVVEVEYYFRKNETINVPGSFMTCLVIAADMAPLL